ncbi:MAG: DegT/DnrJ/EryC1/StrS family aminotransferase [Betaproteobacteria bacterium]
MVTDAAQRHLRGGMRIPPMKPSFTDADRREILRRIDASLAMGQVAQGANTEEFEERFATYVGTRHAVAVANGSCALEAALRARGIEGREVLVPTNTFFATAAAVRFAGGHVRLADVDPGTFSVSVETLQRARTPQTAGVIVVHIGGIITPQIEAIRTWCEAEGFWLLEDCAHAHGSEFAGRRAGRFGYAGAYSFFATKVMTSGEGGMVVTDDDHVAQEIRLLRDHGKADPWVSHHTRLGANWRMCEFAAAVGVVQLARLDEIIECRARVATRYTAALSGIPEPVPVLPRHRASWYKYIALLPPGMNREIVKRRLKEQGVALSGGVYEAPLHRQPVFGAEADVARFPCADDVCARHICLPVYGEMTETEIEHVVAAVAQAVSE